MLDTYEDLSSSPEVAQRSLQAFATRFSSDRPDPAPPYPRPDKVAPRDRAHLLLIERHATVDALFMSLPADDRVRINLLIHEMASGMIEYSQVFHRQGGVLDQPEQVIEYCHRVIGLPALFVIETMSGELSTDNRQDALRVAELIQLANITRDVEKDLESGVAYHAALRPHLGSNGEEDAEMAVQQARKDLMLMATGRAASFRQLLDRHELPLLSPARSAAVLMMLFTNRHYRQMASSVGIADWSGPNSLPAMLIASLPAAWSARWADRIVRRVEAALLAVV
jgi:hypothetical protein